MPEVIDVRRSLARVAFFDRTLPDDLAESLWIDPLGVLALGAPLQAAGLRVTVRFQWSSKAYVLKHYSEPTWRHGMKRLIQRSRAWSTWDATNRLADAGIATPRPVACVENRLAGLQRDSFLMYPYVEGDTLGSCLGQYQPRSLVDGVWQQLTDVWDRLKTLRASLADTHPANFIVSPSGKLWVIDLDKTRFHHSAYFARMHQDRGWKRLVANFQCA
jgi:Lipopolysaccharide kinase (Kdo/WaaP) family